VNALVNSLLSLGLVAGCGAGMRRLKLLGDGAGQTISVVAYYVALPALFFTRLSRMDLATVPLQALAGSFAPMGLAMVLPALLLALKRIGRETFVLWSAVVLFGSNAFFGLAFFESLYGGAWMEIPVLTASLLGTAGVLLTSLLFEFLCADCGFWPSVLRLARSPLLIASVAGVVCSLLQWTPAPLMAALDRLASIAGPIAIFALGTFMVDHFNPRSLWRAAPIAAYRVVVLPAAALAVVALMGIDDGQLRGFLVLQTGVPCAVSVAIIARKHNRLVEEAAAAVVLTSLASFVALPLIHLIVQ